MVLSLTAVNPKTYSMTTVSFGTGPDGCDEYSVSVKAKGFSVISLLLNANNEENLFHDMLMNTLHPLPIGTDNTSSAAVATVPNKKCPRWEIPIFQPGFKLDQRSLLPKRMENNFKHMSPVGPQFVIEIEHFCSFVSPDLNVGNANRDRHANMRRKAINRPRLLSTTNCPTYCGLDPDDDETGPSCQLQSPNEDQMFESDTNCTLVPKIAGFLPIYPLGHSHTRESYRAFEALAFKSLHDH